MEAKIENYVRDKFHLKYVPINDQKLIEQVHNVLIKYNHINNEIIDNVLYFYIGLSFYERCDFNLAIEYLSKAQELGYECAFILGNCYSFINNTINAKKYYQKSIETGNMMAAFELGRLFEKEENYDEMKKYYTMAINNDDKMFFLIRDLIYYAKKNDNVNDYKTFCKIAISKGINKYLDELVEYYINNDQNNKAAELLIDFIKINDNNTIIDCYINLMQKYIDTRNNSSNFRDLYRMFRNK